MTKRVAEQGMGALALTDHGGMYGVIPFYAAAKKAGIKPPDPISRRLTRSRIIPPRPPAERG